MPGKVHGGRHGLRHWCIPMDPLSRDGGDAVQHWLQNQDGELLGSSPSFAPVAPSSWPSSHGYGCFSGFMAFVPWPCLVWDLSQVVVALLEVEVEAL